MNIEILKTGSDGNAVLLNDCILIDIGVPYKVLRSVQNKIQIVLLTHIHGDHFNPSAVQSLAFARPSIRWACGSWMVKPLVEAGVQKTQIDVVEVGGYYDYRIFSLEPVPLSHDVPNIGWKICMNMERAFYATDTANLNGIEARHYDLYLIEANYDEEEIETRIKEKEMEGLYAYEKRVIRTHLSYQQANDFLYAQMGNRSQYIYLHQHREKEDDERNQFDWKTDERTGIEV